MYFSSRSAQVRNLLVAIANGSITLIILLIAPLGLAAVIINTLLVTVATYFTALTADRIILFLQGERSQRAESLNRSRAAQIQRVESNDLERRQE
ncbi:MAG TPA: CRISPR-associated protein Csx18 [Trichocoleus sp.]|jgi:hypothetical protein